MTSTNLFGDHDPAQEVDPEKAASALGDILSFFKNDTGSAPISQGIGTTGAEAQTDTQQPQGTGEAAGGHASPVPEGTGVSQGYGGEGGHPGVDLAVPLDTQLLAAASGTVTVASDADPGGYGLYVEIQTPDGFTLRYGHLHAANVKVGDQVRAGQVIGKSGGEANGPLSGNSEGPHLHFEVRADGHSIDPTPFLAGGYQVIGGTGSDTSVTSTADPKALAAVQLQNVVNVLGGKPTQDLTQPQAQKQGQQSGVIEGDMDSYFNAVLSGLGLPITDANLKFMRAWQKAEGGDGTNPFNTTQDAPGASNFNSVGVKRYPDAQTGVQATIKTLSNGLYANILAALQAGNDPLAVANALANSPWGTGALVKQILGGA